MKRNPWIVALVVALVFGSIPVIAQVTKVYFSSGGDKLTVASTGEIEVQSGGTLDLQSGHTFTYGDYTLVFGVGTIDSASATKDTIVSSGIDANSRLVSATAKDSAAFPVWEYVNTDTGRISWIDAGGSGIHVDNYGYALLK